MSIWNSEQNSNKPSAELLYSKNLLSLPNGRLTCRSYDFITNLANFSEDSEQISGFTLT